MVVLSHGPHIGRLTTHSARIWLRLSGPGTARVRLTPGTLADSGAAAALADPEAVVATSAPAATDSDYVVTCDLSDLTPDTGYVYQVEVSEDGQHFTTCDVGGRSTGGFSTLPDTPHLTRELVFGFGSCIHPYRRDDRLFDGIDVLTAREPALRFMFLMGDQVYADLMPKELIGADGAWHTPYSWRKARKYREALDKGAYRRVYRAFWASLSMRRALMRLPAFTTLDDHEIADDWGIAGENRDASSQARKDAALSAYELYQHCLNPETPAGRYWFEFRIADIGFFVLDTRTARHWPGEEADKVLLDHDQMEALETWLLANRDLPAKFIISSVPLVHISSIFGVSIPPLISATRDQWTGFKVQRKRLIDTIVEADITGVYVISGDVHMSHVAAIGTERQPDKIHSFTASPLVQESPIIHEYVALKEKISGYQVKPIFKGAGTNFGIVRIRPRAEQAAPVAAPGQDLGHHDQPSPKTEGPTTSGLYDISCELHDRFGERYFEYPGTAHIVLDVDRTLSTSSVLRSSSIPYLNAATIVNHLHSRYGIVYLTARPRLLPHIGLVRAWLRDHGFPASQVIMLMNLLDLLPWRHGIYKKKMLTHMIEHQRHTPVLGIGDRITDAEAYLANDMFALIINDDDEPLPDHEDVYRISPSAERTVWDQIHDVVRDKIGDQRMRERVAAQQAKFARTAR